MKLSVVATLYRSAAYIEEFYERITQSARKITDDYEIILVNDGSPDNSLEKVITIAKKDTRVTVVDLSRNFGHHKAIMVGLEHASGERVFLIDTDLEEDPALLEEFSEIMTEKKCDVVFGIVPKRPHGIIIKFLSDAAIKLYKFLSGIQAPNNQSTVRLMSARYVKSLLQFHEEELFLAGIFVIAGYEQVAVLVDKKKREETSYTFKKRMELFVTAICSFSVKPLVYICYLGVLVFLTSLIMSGYLVIKKIFFQGVVSGWASVIVSMWLLGGLMIGCLGIVALYISKIFIEVKQRPRTIIRSIHCQSKKHP